MEQGRKIRLDIQNDTFVLGYGNKNKLLDCKMYAAWKYDGDTEWIESYSNKLAAVTITENKVAINTQIALFNINVEFVRIDEHIFTVSGELTNTGEKAIEIARFHYLDGSIEDKNTKLISMRQYELPGRMFRFREEVVSPREYIEKAWRDMGVFWPRLSDPIHDTKNIAISGDIGLFSEGWNNPGWFFGFYGPGTSEGEIGFRTMGEIPAFFAGVLLDGILIDSGETRELEQMIMSYGEFQDEIKRWISMCKESMGILQTKPPLVGYCSWYAKTHTISPDDLYRAILDYRSFPSPPGGKTIQIDDGFQVMPGDWKPNKRWENDLDLMPEKIRQMGGIPGLWLAPTAIHESHEIVKKHPEWLQRLPSGEFAISFLNWGWAGEEGSKTFYLEPDHPEAKKYIKDILKENLQKGWRYLKLDFAYTVSTARVKYDRKKTYFETLRDLWKLFREVCGEYILINACVGGVWRWAAGTADIARMGGDMIGEPAVIRERLAEVLLRMNSNGKWWQADPDVFCIWRENFQLDNETAYLLTATEGLMGGVFITSDFASDWDEEGCKAVSEFWNEKGPRVPADYYVLMREDGLPDAFAVTYPENEDVRYGVALYNWENKASTVQVHLKELRMPLNSNLNLITTGRNKSIRLDKGILTVENQPASSVRIAWLK